MPTFRAGHATTLPRQRDHVFRPHNCLLLHWLFIQCGFSIWTPRQHLSNYFLSLQLYYVAANLKKCRMSGSVHIDRWVRWGDEHWAVYYGLGIHSFQMNATFLRSFAFFSKEYNLLAFFCILYKKNTAFFAFFFVFYERTLRSFTFFVKEKNTAFFAFFYVLCKGTQFFCVLLHSL